MLKTTEYNTIGELVYKEQMDNGLTVVLLPKTELTKTYAIFATAYGSIDQTFVPLGSKEKITVPEGIAHFLEHKLFEKEDRDVFQDFSKYGASANAFTSFTTTAYLFSATNHILENTKTLIDFVQSPYFTHESVEKEKGIIAQEINMYDDQPDWRSFMGTIKNMFQNNPVNVDIAGTVESIQDITKDDLYTCYETFYHPQNMVLFITGNFDANEMADMIRQNQRAKSFQSIGEIERFYPEESEHVYKKSSTLKMNVSIPRSTIGIKENVESLSSERLLRRDLLIDMAMDYFYSKGGKYYRALYDESLIDGSFYYDTTIDKHFAYSLIGSNTRDGKAFAETIKGQLLNTKSYSFSERTFNTLKKKKIGQLLRSMNSLEFIANQYIHYNSLGADFFALIPIIENLTVEDMNEFLATWITEDRLTTHHIIPETNK